MLPRKRKVHRKDIRLLRVNQNAGKEARNSHPGSKGTYSAMSTSQVTARDTLTATHE